MRRTVRPFTEKQIELLSTFADQAVIAIENSAAVRGRAAAHAELPNRWNSRRPRQRCSMLSAARHSISSAVFETVAESSVRLCGADRAFIFRFDGEMLRMAVAYNTPPEFKEFVEQNPIRPGRHSCAARAALECRTIHIPDVLADPEYTFGARAVVRQSRTVLGVPILKGDDLLGVMIIYHQRGHALHGQADRTSRDFCRSSSDRDRECSTDWMRCASAPMNLAVRSRNCARSEKCRRQ